MVKDFYGVYPVIQTPFHSDGTLDLDQVRHELDWMYGHGVSGAVIGMVSEILKLSDHERDALADTVCQHARDNGRQAIVSVGAESTHHALQRAMQAEQAGADALMAVPPLTAAVDTSGMLQYFVDLLEATSTPLVVQDASGYVGQPIPISVLVQLQNQYGDRVLFKPEAQPIGPRLSTLRDNTGGHARIFEGSGGIALVDSHHRGIVGTMPAADLCWALVALWRALEAGETAAADLISAPLIGILNLQNELDSYVAIEKYLLHKQGVLRTPTLREPVTYTLDRETVAEIDRHFEALHHAVDGATEEQFVPAPSRKEFRPVRYETDQRRD